MVANGQSVVATRLEQRERSAQREGTLAGCGASPPVSRGRALQQAIANGTEFSRTDMDASPHGHESDATAVGSRGCRTKR
jgi:hypothetical protein